jgi:hypothetical protein
MLVEINNRKLLLTGDARGDDIVEGWKAAGHDPDEPVHIDIMKMPHHGSDRNITEKIFKLFPADHYVISADGKHRTPPTNTIRALARTLANSTYTGHLTNRTPAMRGALDALEEERAQPGRRFDVKFRDEDSSFLQIALD